MSIRRLGKSKAKAALARVNSNDVDNTALSNRITDLEESEFRIPVVTITTDTSPTLSQRMFLCDATSGVINITLPAASTCIASNESIWYGFSKIDSSSNAITITPDGTDLIFGQSSFDLTRYNDTIKIITDGTNWYLGD